MSGDNYDLNCPSCGKHYTLPRDKVVKNAGKRIHCRSCHKLFVIPLPAADEPLMEAVSAAPELGHPSEHPVAQTTAVADPPDNTPIPIAATDEPPPLSEYSESPITDLPSESHAPAESESAPEATDHDSFHGVSIADEATRDEGETAAELPSDLPANSEIEAPPPQLPPVPVSPAALPKPRRSVRALVAPVFAPTDDEEPQPRRRGRFGMRTQPPEPIEAAAPPTIQTAAPTAKSPPNDSVDIASPLIETAQPEPVPELESSDEASPLEQSADVAADAAPLLPISEDPSIQISPPVPSAAKTDLAIATPASQDLSAIRRSVALLAAMSVIIAIVLIAVLLTLLGIIPKK